MPKASRHGTPAQDNETATLWADLGEGTKNYRRIRYNDWLNFEERQYHRRLAIEKINAAPPIEDTVAGYPWRTAWMKVQTMLFIDGRYKEMEGPQEWIQEKLKNRPKRDG